MPKKSYEDVSADRDFWREAFQKESDAHSKTRTALAEEQKRGDAAVEAANTANSLLASLQHVAITKSDRQ